MKRFRTFFVLGLLCYPIPCRAQAYIDDLFGTWKVVRCEQYTRIIPMTREEAEALYLHKTFTFRPFSIMSDHYTCVKPMYGCESFIDVDQEYSQKEINYLQATAGYKGTQRALDILTNHEFPLDRVSKLSDQLLSFVCDGFLFYMVRIPSVCGAYIQESSAVEELKLTGHEDTLRFNYDFTLGPAQLLIEDDRGRQIYGTEMKRTASVVAGKLPLDKAKQLTLKVRVENEQTEWRLNVEAYRA